MQEIDVFSKKTKQDKVVALQVVDGGKARSTRGISMLADGCTFEGKMLLNGESRLGGKIKGFVVSNGILTIEESAVISGQVTGDFIQINGHVDGDVRASELLRLSNTARISGDICAKKLIVEEGASINGRVSELEKTVSNSSASKAVPVHPKNIEKVAS